MPNQPKDDLVPELKNIARVGAGVPPKDSKSETGETEQVVVSVVCLACLKVKKVQGGQDVN